MIHKRVTQFNDCLYESPEKIGQISDICGRFRGKVLAIAFYGKISIGYWTNLLKNQGAFLGKSYFRRLAGWQDNIDGECAVDEARFSRDPSGNGSAGLPACRLRSR